MRILDHDGLGEAEGGIMRWLRLCEAWGSIRPMCARKGASCRRRASRSTPMSASCASSPSWRRSPARSPSCSRPGSIEERIPGMLAGYPFVTEEMMSYFRKRLDQAPRDAGFALGLCPRACRHGREASGGVRGADLQVRRALGPARCAQPCLRSRRRHPAGRLRARGHGARRVAA